MDSSAPVSAEAPLFDIQGIYEKRDFIAFSVRVLRPSVWGILRGALMVTAALAVVRFFVNWGDDFRGLLDGSLKQATPLMIYVLFFLFYLMLIPAIWLVNRLRLGRRFAEQPGLTRNLA